MNIGFIILLAIFIFLIFLWLKFFKHLAIGCICLITGGVKTGKSTLAVATATYEYRKALFNWYISKFFCKLFRKPIPEMPYFYSNVPIKVKNYVPLELKHLLREKRFHYKSVVYLQEASLLCDSQLIKDKDLNNKLMLFFKLFGHETHGGKLIIDTQSICDTHYSLKRSLSNYIYIHHIKKIPFFIICYVRELMHSEDNSTINVVTKDVESDLKRIIISKRVWKKFDCYSLSSFTDFLDKDGKIVRINKLKVNEMVSFRPEFNFNVDDMKKQSQLRSDYEKKNFIETKNN